MSGFTPTEYETLYKLYSLKKNNPKEYEAFWEYVKNDYLPKSQEMFVIMLKLAQDQKAKMM